MGRGYQTTQRNYVDDFVFKPNMELAMTALAKKEDDVQSQIDSLDFLGNLPIDYWKDVDSENAKALKENYESKVNDIAQQMQGNLLNTGASNRAISNLRNEVKKDLEFGDLGKIQENAKAYKEYQAKLAALKDPADRENYKKMVDNYIQSTDGRGALSSVFKPDEMYDSRNVWNEFLNSNAFKGLNADEQSSQVVNSNGKWLVKNGNTMTELSETKLGQAFKAFMDSSNLKGYGASRQKYAGEDWIDENGEIRMDEGSYLGNVMKNGLPSLSYKKRTSAQDMTPDQYGLLHAQEAMQKRAEKRAESRAVREAEAKGNKNPDGMSDQTSKDISNIYKYAYNKMDYANDKLNRLAAILGVKGKGGVSLTPSNIPALIASAKKLNYNNIHSQLVQLQSDYQNGIRASFQPLAVMGMPDAMIEKYKSNFQNMIKTNGNNTVGTIDFAGSGIAPGFVSNNKGGAVSMSSYPLTISQLPGMDLGGGQRVLTAEIIDGSSYPIIRSYDERNNDVVSQIKLTVANPKFKKNNKDGEAETLTRYVDFYQNSAKLAGTNNIINDYRIEALKRNGVDIK